MELFEIRRCTSEKCKLRFSVGVDVKHRYYCPVCHSNTVIVEQFSRRIIKHEAPLDQTKLVVVADNIRSTWNVGAIFRASDGCGVNHIYLCGITPTPDHSGVTKTALGAENNIAWSHHNDGLNLIISLKNQGYTLLALEGGEGSESLFSIIQEIPSTTPLAIIVGNELTGIDPGLIRECSEIGYLPMLGQKQSLNVAVAFGIAIYTIRFGRVRDNCYACNGLV